MTISPSRIRTLNDREPREDGQYVLYWMQHSQRAQGNPALEHAIELANDREQAVVVGFGLDETYPDATERSFAFLLEGLAETAAALAERGIKLVARSGPPDQVALELAENASIVVCDRGYLRHQRQWRQTVSADASCRVVQVEGDVVVPIDEVSDKVEYAARTIRPKIESCVDEFLDTFSEVEPRKSSLPLRVKGDVDLKSPDAVLEQLEIDREVGRVKRFRGGTSEARRRLTRFLRHGLPCYANGRSDPSEAGGSGLSPYLHFGQISPVEIVRKCRAAESPSAEDREAFLEELIVRRELAINFVAHEPHYDSFRCLPDWAKKTLAEHEDDERPRRYTAKELEAAGTHDRYWNAAMDEMKKTGYMHNTMRMYWGKKILEWCNTPEYAFRVTLDLNNRYFLDGRDPSSYANVAWVFGLHDRAWQERPIFGKVRYMNAKGLERKYEIEDYVSWVNELPQGG